LDELLMVGLRRAKGVADGAKIAIDYGLSPRARPSLRQRLQTVLERRALR